MYYYHPPTKLREDNVFSHVFLSVTLCSGGSHVTIAHDALGLTIQEPDQTQDLTVQGPALGPLAVKSGGQYWIPVQTCSPEEPTC